MNEFVYYKVGDKTAQVPVEKQNEFENKYSDAKILYSYNGRTAEVPIGKKDAFLSKYGADNVSYWKEQEEDNTQVDIMPSDDESNPLADILRDPNLSWWERVKATSRAMDNEEAPNLAETVGKAVGSALTTTGKMAVDATNVAAKIGRQSPVATPFAKLAGTIEAFTGKSVLDEDNPLNEVSENLGKKAEKFSKGADPTGGEIGFGELLKKGHIGLAMQKALASGIESAPIMIATKHPATAVLYMLGAAASNYEEETRENPDIPAWKRAANSVGSAALEMVVEKIADIPWKYFGKAGGEITDDLASGIIERVREEGIQTIAKRIWRAIKNTGKDAASEGFEEVITSLGNDALGTALDAIDGNSDYGFKAQWEEFKEQNPEATEEDFAWSKGKEYFESFLGGSLSSIYIAGFGNAVKETREAKARNQFDNAYLYGGSLDYNSMYDTNDDVNIALENVVSASKNQNGEETLTRDFIESLSAEDAFALSRSEDVKEELRNALGELAVAKATQDGLNGKLDTRLQGEIDGFTAIVNDAAENGNVVSGVYNNDTVFIKGGVVHPDGTVTLPNGQHGPVIVIDGNNKFTVDSKEISNARSQSVDTYLTESEELFRGTEEQKREFARNTMGPRAKQRDIQQYENSKIIINSENGLIQVEVQKILPNGSVLIKGKKGDLGGKSEVIMPAAAFYDAIARNDDGSPVFVEKLNGSQQQESQEVEQAVTPAEPVDYRESEQTIMIDGTLTTVEVTNQDDAADKITYTYIDANGQPRIGSSTVAGFTEAIEQAAQPVQEISEMTSTDELPPIPEEGVPTVPDMSSPVATESAETTNPSVEETAPIFPSSDVHDETPLQKPKGRKEEEEGGEIALEQEEINWDALFEQDKDAYLAELQNQFGEETLDILNEEIETAQNEIDSLGKAKTKNQNERIANRKKKSALQERINTLNGMVAQLTTPTDVEVTEEAIAETPVAEETMEEVAETPIAETTTEPVIEEAVTSEPVVEEAVAEEPVVEQTEETVEPVSEQISEPAVESAPVIPVAPNPVANPVDMALDEEKKLRDKLERTDMNRNEKRDWAYKYGKKVADMFATRDDYAAYEAVAESLGAYDADFERGVEESFANRQNNKGISQQNKGNEQRPSTLNRIEDTAVAPTETQKEIGKFVIQWLRDAGYVVHTDITELDEAIKRSENDKTQFLTTPDGEVYGLMQNGEIYLDMSLLNPNTPIHEYTHIWDAIIMEKNPQLWEEGKKLLKQLPLWNEIANSKRYKNLQGDEDLIASEVHSRLVGEKGDAVFTQLYERASGHINEIGVELDLITKIKNWIYQVMDNLKSIIIPYGRDKSVSLQEFIAMPLNDLVFNAKPRNRFTETNKLYWGEQPTNALSDYATIAVGDIYKFNGHAQQYYVELENGIGYVVYDGSVYIFDIDSDGLARPIKKFDSYEEAKKRVDVFNRRNTSGHNSYFGEEGDKTAVNLYNNSSDGIRGASENVHPVAKRESEGNGGFKTGRQNDRPQHSVGGSSVESDGLLFRSSSIDEEMEAIKNEAIANGTFMKAPNGKPTKLNERQWLQVRTQNFLNWFGDWINDPKNASKVVDENGEPMVVYHGSPYGNITEFNRKGHSVSGLREFGTYFGSNRRLAELYAYARQQAKGDIEKYELEKAKIDAIIFDPETPPRVALDAFDELDKLNESQKPKVYEVFLNIRNPKEFDAEKNNGYKGWHKLKQDVGYDIKTGVEAVEAIAGHNSAARMSEKYDGIIAHNMADVHHEEGLDELMGDVFLVFDETPSHIKSATNNTGEFSIENPDIRARRGVNNDNFVKQFEFKQNNERGQLEYSDEFRGLQEESARMSEQLVSEKDGVQRAAIRGLVERIGGTLQRELDRAISGRGYKLRNVVNESKGTSFDIIENVDGRLFHDIFAIVRAYLPNGELVDLHDNYNDAICYITSDGLAGFAVDANGNLISVYSLYGASKKGFLGAIKDLITEAGATHLDGYNSQLQPLAEIYSKVFGWKVASMMDYNMDYDHDNIAKNHKMPQVAFMVNTNEDIETKHFDKDQYDEAEGYQKEQVENSQRTEAQNAAIDYTAGDARVKAIENAVNEEAAKLGVKVTYKTREQMPKGHKNDKGYYNTKTGEIVICYENAIDVADAIKTILHEAVAHKGLRKLIGDKFNEFINRVYNSLDADTKAKVDALATANYNGDKAVAMEEYMATLAESENFAENSVWDKVKSIFTNIINAILGRNDIKIGDNELRYILRASYNNMVNPRGMESVAGWAQDQLMREEYGVNETAETPELLSRTGVDPTEVAATSARQVYEKMVSDDWNEFQRQFQDAYQPVRVAIEAIQAETGDIPIEDYENYLLAQNQSSSRSRVEIDKFQRKYYRPIVKQVNKIIDEIMKSHGWRKRDKKRRAEVYKEVRQYLIAKHGLERNAYYQNTKGEMRDFAGLTGLFGLPSTEYQIAEQIAQDLVDDFEALIGDTMRDELWDKINSATDKTLRHSYESGLISRQQYNDIKAMFDFYIPLRGFDETTAEDVYAYARFEGNRFNPAVQTAKGRTSIADDPIATIMNMAESEIAQGNKNRAKQALYNYLLNRATANNGQNSLMQLQDVWFTITYDAFGNPVYQIAAPNFAIGETYEQFEARMQTMEAAGLAAKSKKGQVDVGMRFQKKMHQNAHYVYLKINGVDKAIFINGNPKAVDAINGTYKQKSLFGEDKMRAISRFISSTFTNYSLEFTARNYFRDMLYSHINIDIRESDPAYRKKFRQNWRHNNLRTMVTMLKAYRAGEYDSRPLTVDEAAFVEFMENGGQTGYTLINSVENHKRDLEKAIERMQKGIDKGGVKDSTVFRFTLGAIELLNEASELVTRFAAYKTSRDMGRSVLTSVSDAKEITVNFNTKGAQDGVGFLGFVARYFGASKFFFNASVQGVQNIKAMADANKLKFCGVVGGLTATGFLMPIVTAAITELLGGDDDEEYWNIPEYDRQNNICIVLGNGKYAKIPLPIGFREVYAIGDMVAAMLMDKKFSRDAMQVGIDIANKISSVVLPVNPLESSANGLSIMHSIAYVAAPSSAQFVIQELSNTDWKGAPLQKEYTYNENDPQWMKAYASNPEWMKMLSKWCNEHIGDADMKGWDWSPEKLDNRLSNMFGGIYTLIKKSGRSISAIWNEENRNLSNVPLAGVIVGSGIDSDDRFVDNAYYEMKDYYDKRIGYIERRAKTFGLSLDDVFVDMSDAHQPKMQEIYSNKEFDFMKEWYLGNKELEKMKNGIKKEEKRAAKEGLAPEDNTELAALMNEYETERREFVNDMLELD